VPLGVVRGKLGVDIRIAEASRSRIGFHLGDHPRQRGRAGSWAEHAADEPSDCLAIARVGKRYRDLGLDWDRDGGGLLHRTLRGAEYSNATPPPHSGKGDLVEGAAFFGPTLPTHLLAGTI
jgi:hypothetical protein